MVTSGAGVSSYTAEFEKRYGAKDGRVWEGYGRVKLASFHKDVDNLLLGKLGSISLGSLAETAGDKTLLSMSVPLLVVADE